MPVINKSIAKVANPIALKPVGTNSGDTACITFLELKSNGDKYVGLQAPDSVTSTSIWTLPSADGASGSVLTTNGSKILAWTPIPVLNTTLPAMDMTGYGETKLSNYILQKSYPNLEAEILAVEYTHGATAVADAYQGGVYSPTQNRIYMVPRAQGDQTNWHYIDCSDSSIVAYAHGVTAVSDAYSGGVYSPTQNRIYFVPQAQGNQTNWHYVDCSDGSVVAYAHGVTAVADAYDGAAYSPTEDRIYFCPASQNSQTNWHYIDCSDPVDTTMVNAYAHGLTGLSVMRGACYSPAEDKIYFIPCNTSTNAVYIDCSDGSANAITPPTTSGNDRWWGGRYSPTENRIYLVPFGMGSVSSWWYIDCDTGTYASYVHGAGGLGTSAFMGSVYSPTQNRIYLVPHGRSNSSTWHYIDCSDGSVASYEHGLTVSSNAYAGGTFSPTEDVAYFIPRSISNSTEWHCITNLGENPKVSKSLMGGPIFNVF